jgi:glycosyltransferase involved in cell wall biosynthesis
VSTADVRVYFASINTAAVTELCVRTMRLYAGYPFELVVGDCGSTDGSLEMLRRFERRHWLELEVAPDGRRHPDWLDGWFATCPARYAVFCDSDIQFRRAGWLQAMVERARAEDAALVATRIQARGGVDYQHPRTGARRILAERPEPWLMLIDIEKTRGVVATSFAYRDELQADGHTKVAFDTSAAFFRDVQRAGLHYAEMPPDFARAYHHYGSLSWQKSDDRTMPMTVRVKQLLKRVRVQLNLRIARRREPREHAGNRD